MKELTEEEFVQSIQTELVPKLRGSGMEITALAFERLVSIVSKVVAANKKMEQSYLESLRSADERWELLKRKIVLAIGQPPDVAHTPLEQAAALIHLADKCQEVLTIIAENSRITATVVPEHTVFQEPTLTQCPALSHVTGKQCILMAGHQGRHQHGPGRFDQ